VRGDTSSRDEKDISIVLCGQAGQGIQTVEFLLTRLLKRVGYNVFATKEYMSRVRGGMNSTTIRISSKPVRALVDRIDILVALDRGAVAHVEKRISADTVVLAEKQIIGDDFERVRDSFADVPFVRTAADIGSKVLLARSPACSELTTVLLPTSSESSSPPKAVTSLRITSRPPTPATNLEETSLPLARSSSISIPMPM
jgi:hypothetical protein